MTTLDRRLMLSEMLNDILSEDRVYYEPSESTKMKYPAIVYTRSSIHTKRADNVKYLRNDQYTITFIRKNADDPVLDKLLELPYCQHSSRYTANGLHHDVFNIYV